MTKRIVIISDVQTPFEDRKALNAVISFIGEYQPDEVIQIGDLVDFPQPSRWNKDTRGEFEGSVFADAEYTKRRFFEPLRAVYHGPLGIHEGNHDLRPREYLNKYAPALAERSDLFNFENLLDFDGFEAVRLPDFYDVAPGWITTHGHLGGIRLTQEAGRTAYLAAVNRFHKSVIMGHTHRLGVSTKTFGYGGNIVSEYTGFEVGHLMNMRKATYLKSATANWQMGFGILHVEGRHVRPEPVYITNGKFTVEGETFRL